MQRLWETLLPAKADNTIRGLKLPVYFFALITIGSLTRSLIHLLAPDGGAGSIASMDLSAGAEGIIFAFGLWGSSQLLFALVQLLVLLRYRSLIPFMYLMLILETLLRQLVGAMKPAAFADVPPGGYLNQVMLPLAILMLLLSLWSARKQPNVETRVSHDTR
jgi:hypothetical protein